MKRAVSLTLIVAGLWALGSVWYYDCKIKRVCGPQETLAPTADPAPAAVAAAPAAAAVAAEGLEATAGDETPTASAEASGPESQAASAAPTPPAAAAPLPDLEQRNVALLVLRASFDARSAALKPPTDAAARLELLQRGIAQGRKVLVLGHSDGLGARSRIAVVSQQRADALRDWLIAQGIRASDIARVESREDREPIASNSRPEGRSLNRRAEALLTPLPQE